MPLSLTREDVRSALRCNNPRCPCYNGTGNVHCPAHEDDVPSLTVHEHDGKLLVHCQSGCDQIAVVEALKSRDLWPTPKSKGNGHAPRHMGPPIATFDYRDANGQLLYEVVRFPNFPDGRKDFCQRKPAKTGGWAYKIGDVDRVPYRLPELVAAVRKGHTILIPEGEKDVESLRALGCHATCNAGGAGKWQAEWAVYFGGAKVAILPDNDDPGRKHALDIARSLNGTAASIKIVDLPGLLPKGDVTDWLNADHALPDLVAVIKACPEWTPPVLEPVAEEPFHPTQDGDALRFLARYGDEMRVFGTTWRVWDGIRWAEAPSCEVFERIRTSCMEIFKEVGKASDKEVRERLYKHGLHTESASYRQGVEKIAKNRKHIFVQPDLVDAHDFLFNAANGTINLKNGCLQPAVRDDLLTKMTRVDYDPSAESSLWERFLQRVLPDAQVRDFVQRAAGYALTGDVSEQCFFFLFGSGKNGKSVFLKTVMQAMGEYASVSTADLLLEIKSERLRPEIADLKGRRLVTTIEIADGRKLAENLVKQLTGGDRINARFLYEKNFEFDPTHKIFIAANHRPVVKGTDFAIWRRIMLVPFTETIPDSEADPHLSRKLKAELPGVLNWCVQGCLMWQTHGLQPPESVKHAVEEYRAEQDVTQQFIDEACECGTYKSVNATVLYQAYRQWCLHRGEEPTPIQQFGRVLTDKGFQNVKQGGQVERRGINLKGESLV